jgi:hypothetical protein
MKLTSKYKKADRRVRGLPAFRKEDRDNSLLAEIVIEIFADSANGFGQ